MVGTVGFYRHTALLCKMVARAQPLTRHFWGKEAPWWYLGGGGGRAAVYLFQSRLSLKSTLSEQQATSEATAAKSRG